MAGKKICSKQSWANSATLCLLISKFIYCTSNSGKTVTCLENLKAIIQFLSEVKQNLIFHMEAPESFRTHTLVYFQRICSKVALTKVTQEDKLHFGVVKIRHFPQNSNISNVWFTGNPNLSKKSLSTKYAMNIQLKSYSELIQKFSLRIHWRLSTILKTSNKIVWSNAFWYVKAYIFCKFIQYSTH